MPGPCVPTERTGQDFTGRDSPDAHTTIQRSGYRRDMTPDRRDMDARLDDMVFQLRALAPVAGMVARHDAEIDALGDGQRRIERLITEVRDECRENARRNAWTPMVKAAVIGPTVASLIAAVALVLTKGAG